MVEAESESLQVLRTAARPLDGPRGDWGALLDAMSSARVVLLGEATHGTHEFYAARAELTMRLIAERGFQAVVLEGDWPDAHRLHRYVTGLSGDAAADEALIGFDRFPRWMWRNVEVRDFAERLYEHNLDAELRAGIYGMDLYSLHASADAVVRFLRRVDPEAAALARERYACFDPYRGDVSEYGRESAFKVLADCEPHAVRQLVELLRERARYVRRDGEEDEDAFFDAEQNARLVLDAESYYRNMYRGGVQSWNQRDTHMATTVDAILDHLRQRHGEARIVVWAHNSHLGDARATSMSRAGELNVGQLLRERHPGQVFSLGFTTYTGTVIAAHAWDGPGVRMAVVPGLEGSLEALFHELELPRFWLPTRELADALPEQLLERAIGVVYRPHSERWSHYFEVEASKQFDAIAHFDETHGVRPLDIVAHGREEEPPETFPTGI